MSNSTVFSLFVTRFIVREDAVDRVRDAVLGVRVGLPAAQRLDLARCVAHGDGERNRAQHFEIVFAVSDGGGVVEIGADVAAPFPCRRPG